MVVYGLVVGAQGEECALIGATTWLVGISQGFPLRPQPLIRWQVGVGHAIGVLHGSSHITILLLASSLSLRLPHFDELKWYMARVAKDHIGGRFAKVEFFESKSYVRLC